MGAGWGAGATLVVAAPVVIPGSVAVIPGLTRDPSSFGTTTAASGAGASPAASAACICA